MTGALFGIGATLTIMGILNWDRAVVGSFAWLVAFWIGLGAGVVGGAINIWVDRLAKKP